MSRINYLLILLAGMLVFGGCAQSTHTPFAQQPVQDVLTPTSSEQESATQGSTVSIWVLNAPGRAGTPATPQTALGDGGIAPLLAQIENAEGKADVAGAGYAQSGIHVTVTTGGTTPTQTGTATGTATATASPVGTQTASPVQDVKPETGVAVPIAVAPGGIVDQAASASGGEGSAQLDKASTNDLRLAELLEGNPDLIQVLLALFNQQTPPVEAEGGGDGAGD